MRTEAEEILGSRGAEQGDALIRDLDQLIDAAQRAAGPETDVAIDAALLAYDRDLLALISMPLAAHVKSMSQLERIIALGLATIVGGLGRQRRECRCGSAA